VEEMNEKLKTIKKEKGIRLEQKGSIAWMLLNPETVGSKNMDLGILQLESNNKTKPNIHPSSEEMFYILKGHGRIIVENESTDIEPGLAIYIPQNVEHTFENTGTEPMVFLLMHAPPETKEEVKRSPWKQAKS
jgi:mannose-6-phosphate isomerase-like protein (cupin superfamily)